MKLDVTKLIELALEEDLGRGDYTAFAIPESSNAVAKIIAKKTCVLSNSFLIAEVIQVANFQMDFSCYKSDGEEVAEQECIASLQGNARELVSIERTILNFLQRSCGIATEARKYKKLLGDRKLKILDTRKTVPAWRMLEKKAVRDGGLWNHRIALDDAVLIKENHIRAAGSITTAIQNVKANCLAETPLEIEVTSFMEAEEAISAGANALLLDNFSAADLKSIVTKLRTKHKDLVLEASGGIHLGNIAAYLDSGVDRISVGALTHSVVAADLSMLFDFS